MLNLIVRTQARVWKLKNQLEGEEGQTSSEYVIIAGVIVFALVIILGIFRNNLQTQAQAIMNKLTGAIK